jgi:hypothetical protein
MNVFDDLLGDVMDDAVLSSAAPNILAQGSAAVASPPYTAASNPPVHPAPPAPGDRTSAVTISELNAQLPDGWTCRLSRTYPGKVVYQNQSTGETTFVRPRGFATGDAVEVFSQSFQSWQTGRVVKVEGGKVTALYGLMADNSARMKVVDPTDPLLAQYFRATSAGSAPCVPQPVHSAVPLQPVLPLHARTALPVPGAGATKPTLQPSTVPPPAATVTTAAATTASNNPQRLVDTTAAVAAAVVVPVVPAAEAATVVPAKEEAKPPSRPPAPPSVDNAVEVATRYAGQAAPATVENSDIGSAVAAAATVVVPAASDGAPGVAAVASSVSTTDSHGIAGRQRQQQQQEEEEEHAQFKAPAHGEHGGGSQVSAAYRPRVTNILATCSLGCEVDLRTVRG